MALLLLNLRQKKFPSYFNNYGQIPLCRPLLWTKIIICAKFSTKFFGFNSINNHIVCEIKNGDIELMIPAKSINKFCEFIVLFEIVVKSEFVTP